MCHKTAIYTVDFVFDIRFSFQHYDISIKFSIMLKAYYSSPPCYKTPPTKGHPTYQARFKKF